MASLSVVAVIYPELLYSELGYLEKTRDTCVRLCFVEMLACRSHVIMRDPKGLDGGKHYYLNVNMKFDVMLESLLTMDNVRGGPNMPVSAFPCALHNC